METYYNNEGQLALVPQTDQDISFLKRIADEPAKAHNAFTVVVPLSFIGGFDGLFGKHLVIDKTPKDEPILTPEETKAILESVPNQDVEAEKTPEYGDRETIKTRLKALNVPFSDKQKTPTLAKMLVEAETTKPFAEPVAAQSDPETVPEFADIADVAEDIAEPEEQPLTFEVLKEKCIQYCSVFGEAKFAEKLRNRKVTKISLIPDDQRYSFYNELDTELNQKAS